MKLKRKRFFSILTVLLTGILILSFAAPVSANSLKFGRKCKVMTRNLYVGADLFDVLQADPKNPIGIPVAVSELIKSVNNANFPERAEALADEIASIRPDLVGLQEVSWIRFQNPGDFALGTYLPNANENLYNYLDILTAALTSRGLDYEVAAVIENADVELPMMPIDLTTYEPIIDPSITIPLFNEDDQPIPIDVRLTDFDVVLKRSNISVSDVKVANYSDNYTVAVSGLPVEFTRGYIAMDATVRGRTYRFVNTHLEVQGTAGGYEHIQAAQAQELIDELADETLPIIIVGDFNSSSEDPATQPYHLLSDAGYEDVWLRRMWFPETGYTCCQEADLLNEESVLNERVDLVLVRNNLCGHLPFSIIGPTFSTVVGDLPEDKTEESGLWPSDHAGVAAWLWIPFF